MNRTPAPASPFPSFSSPRGLQVSVFTLLVLIWGSTWLAIKVGLESYPPFFCLAVRFCLAGPIFLLIMKLRGEPIPWQPRHQPLFITLGMLSFVLSFGAVYWGEQYISSGLASVLFALMPLFTGLVGHFMLAEEKLGPARIAGLLLGLAGIALIHSSDLAQFHPLAPIAALVVLIAPFVSSVATVISKKRSRDYSPFALAGIPMIYGGLVHVGLWRMLERDHPLVWSWPGVGSIAYLTLIGSVVTFSGYFWLLRQVEVGRLNLLAYLTPLVALALGYLLAGETLTPRMAAGSALVLAGVAMANLRGRRRTA